MKKGLHFFVRRGLPFFAVLVSVLVPNSASGDPSRSSKVLGSDSCSTSGCHGGAGPNRGAHTLWKSYDPHVASAATLDNGRSRAMAQQLGIENPADSKSCTVCHAPNRQVDPSMFATAEAHKSELNGVSCANCHGGAEKWILSHTRPEFPRGALASLGMRQLGSAYQRANSCVACHQNLKDELVDAKHPPLMFELDGLLVAEPKHWRENKGFSHAQTWLVGQAVALREVSAQAVLEPGDRRQAEIEAISELLKATGTGWSGPGANGVSQADGYAKRISSTPMKASEGKAILIKLLSNRAPFKENAFESVAVEYRMWARGFYAERLALAVDRLNQSLPDSADRADALKELFDAAVPPKAFDADASTTFLEKLDVVMGMFPATR